MAKQTINVGSADLAGDGESIRNAFTKVNSNFTEIYTQVPLATTATYAQSFNTSTLVRAAVSATTVVNGTWTLALSTAGSILINGTVFSSGAGSATTSTLVNGTWTVRLGTDGTLTLPLGGVIADAVGNAVIGSNSGTVSIYTLEVMNFTQLAPSNYLWITNQYYSGSLLTSTFGSISGTAVGTTHPVVGLTQLSTSGRGSGAIFQVTVYYNGSSTTYINVGIYYNDGNQQYGTGYAVGDTVTIAGADLGGTTPANNLTFTIGNAVKNNYPAGIDGRIIYDYSNKHFLAYNGSTWTQLDSPLTPSGAKASNAYGVAGQTSYDSTYFYICIATNTWRRVALGSTY